MQSCNASQLDHLRNDWNFWGRRAQIAPEGPWRVWLNGRAGLSDLGDVVLALCRRAEAEDVDASALLGAVSGYVVDAPASARGALEPLMATYDFAVVERAGSLVFFHRVAAPPTDIGLDDFAADAVDDAFAQRGDAADTPVEARVRFLDAARDYLIAGVSARRLDKAEGGVLTVDAPLVLEANAAEGMAQRALADLRAAAETQRIALGPGRLALEPGDTLRFAGAADIFEIMRIEDAETRRLDLRRQRAATPAQLGLGEPNAPVVTPTAPTPSLAILDLAPLPGSETDERPLAAVFASPWLGPHEVHAGATLTRRAVAANPAVVGELLWTLAPGPVDRWDAGNIVRIRLHGGTLTSASREAVLDGANAFAIEADGEWEVLQARTCTLVGPDEYELSGFLRGRLGSAHAMRSPHPVGARIIALDGRLARVDIGAHEWHEALAFAAPPFGASAADPRAAQIAATLPRAALRPWAPAHVRARRVAGGAVEIGWVRCARVGGDAWGAGEPPLGFAGETYRLEILDGEDVRRILTTTAPAFTYGAAEQVADFGVLPASLRLRVAQLDDAGATGLNTELTITL